MVLADYPTQEFKGRLFDVQTRLTNGGVMGLAEKSAYNNLNLFPPAFQRAEPLSMTR
jgi:hypothetical protein